MRVFIRSENGSMLEAGVYLYGDASDELQAMGDAITAQVSCLARLANFFGYDVRQDIPLVFIPGLSRGEGEE